MCKGEAHGDFERQMMPVDSNFLNSALAISSFCGSRQRAFVKKKGMAAGMNVMLNTMGRFGHHIPGM
jgi:hypothetical protein